MFSRINTAMLGGIDGSPVTVECDMRNGMPMFTMIGALSGEVKEAKDRVLTAMSNIGIQIPLKRTTINLAPANKHKKGNYFDLAIALSILVCMGELEQERLENTVVIGELGLDGKLKGLNGVLSISDMTRKLGYKRLILPKVNELEAAIIGDVEVIGAGDLSEIIDFIKGEKIIKPASFDLEGYLKNERFKNKYDFKEVYGQQGIKRAVEIAGSGQHNLLMIGTPGSGKSMISKRIPTILPKLSIKESIEISKIYSVSAMLPENQPLMTYRPFRAPHHTTSPQALSGGGKYPSPGEVSLSHKGVLFLDELPEFQSRSLEILRQPMEEKSISISRVGGKYTYPADFQLIAAMNPCPCGYYPDRSRCRCNDNDIKSYLGKISGPLLDRIDICVEVKSVGIDELIESADCSENESSAVIAARVEAAHEIQMQRFEGSDYCFNSQILPKDMELYCRSTGNAERLIKKAFEKYSLTARGYHKIIKVARTIADLDRAELINEDHMSEALHYRIIDKRYWGEE